jgi:Cu/Ag efflux pump CusA
VWANVRAAIIATLVILLSFVMAAIGMNALGVPANLMSLGALDFGLIAETVHVPRSEKLECVISVELSNVSSAT